MWYQSQMLLKDRQEQIERQADEARDASIRRPPSRSGTSRRGFVF